MKRFILAVVSVFMILALAGCGDGGGTVVVTPPPAVFVTTDIVSDPLYDGDIERFPVTGTLIITQPAVQSVFAGIDPVSGSESRAFLDFHLKGPNGVPGNAIIDSAFLDLFIDQPRTGTIPLQIDLVSFQPPNLIGTDFNRLSLATIFASPTIGFNGQVSINVSTLMDEAQRLLLSDFQVRIIQNTTVGLIEINETTVRAPLLSVTYF